MAVSSRTRPSVIDIRDEVTPGSADSPILFTARSGPLPPSAIPVWRALGRNSRRGVGLLLVLMMTIPFTLAADRVELVIDGEPMQVSTYVEDVAAALGEVGVEVGIHDKVVPSIRTPISDGMAIEVVRAVPVLVVIEGREVHAAVTAQRVDEALIQMGIDLDGKLVDPARSTAVADTSTIHVSTPLTIRVVADGLTRRLVMTPGAVSDALALAGVTPNPDDVVSAEATTPLTDGMVIGVARFATDEFVDQVRLPFQEEVRYNSDMFSDERRVVQSGAEGLRLDTYQIIRLDGDEVGRELTLSEVVAEPVTRIVEVGTATRPPPPPAPSVDDDSVWDRLAQCESSGRWDYSAGRYHGGLQFHPETWNRWKPEGYPAYAYEATREQQIHVAKRLHAVHGWKPWPACSQRLGLA